MNIKLTEILLDFDSMNKKSALENWKKGIDNASRMGCRVVKFIAIDVPESTPEGFISLTEYISKKKIKVSLQVPYEPNEIFWDMLKECKIDELIGTELPRAKTQKLKIAKFTILQYVHGKNIDNIVVEKFSQGELCFDFELEHPAVFIEDAIVSWNSGMSSAGYPEPTKEQWKRFIDKVVSVKHANHKRVVPTFQYLEYIKHHYNGTRKSWHCVNQLNKTGWLTVDTNGFILACKDRQLAIMPKGVESKSENLHKLWDKSKIENWKSLQKGLTEIRYHCSGCSWRDQWESINL